MKKRFTFFSYCILFSLTSYCQKSTTEFTNTQRTALQNFVSSHSQYYFIPETEFDKSTLKAIRNEWGFGKNYKPYFNSNDFNKDGIRDFAVVLANSSDTAGDNTNAAVVVFNGLKNGSYKFAHIEKIELQSELGLSFQDRKLNVLVFETDNINCFITSGKGYKVEPCGSND